MTTNFHTHTYRCKHARGTDEEYVRAAIDAGIKVLGFADHAPMPFPDGFVSKIKLTPEEGYEYVASLKELREKYKDEIEIRIGLEAEYYPEIFEDCLKLWRELGIEYIILGGHFTHATEWREGFKAAKAPSDSAELVEYTDGVCEAMKKGVFTYIAHPDILNYVGEDDQLYRECVEKLVKCANEADMPLEINLLGVRYGINYPSDKFWEIVAPFNPKVIIGIDAHSPLDITNPDAKKRAFELVEKYNLNLISVPSFKKI